MQLERREAIELVLSFRASLLSEVATGLSIWFPVTGTGSESKNERSRKKLQKESGALDQKHRGRKSCDNERLCLSYGTTIQFFIQVRFRLARLRRG